MTKENCAIYMAFKKLLYYLYNAKVMNKCDHAPLCKFLTADTPNSKVNNWGMETVNIGHVIFEYLKGTENILVDCILHF